MNPRTRKSADERKTQIVKAALALTAKVGPGRVTTEALAVVVGISQPGIFRHFPKKSDIWDAVAQHIGELLRTNATIEKNKSGPPADPLKNFVSAHLRFLQNNPAIPAILFSRELHAENEKLRAFFAGLVENGHKYLSKLIAAEVASGRFNQHIAADDAAYLILALIQGLMMRWSLNNRNFDLAGEGTRLLELQIAGFRKP